MTLYYQWDFDKRELVQYHRNGECNGCGACCKAMIRFNVSGFEERDPRDGGDDAEHQGIWNEVANDEQRRFFRFTEITPNVKQCSQLTDDNKCAVHFDKFLICSAWPLAPEHVTAFSECSYSFEEIGRWSFDDLPKDDKG